MNYRKTSWLGVAVLAVAFAGSGAGTAPAAVPTAAPTRAAAEHFEIAKLIFEINATDRDGGVQMLLDGENWTVSRVYAPDGRLLLRVAASGELARIGMSELFFEGAEPSFTDLPYRQLLQRFPAGRYRVTGTSTDGQPMVAWATLTHQIPRGARVLSPGARTTKYHTVVDWLPVTKVFHGTAPIDIKGYQVIVEREDPFRNFQLDLPARITRIHIPGAYLQRGTDYKYEVLAVAKGGNQTLTEGEFHVAD